MKTPDFCKKRNEGIAVAVRSVYQQAGLGQDIFNPGIVPLYDLIGAYPVRVTEMRDLTYQRTAEFLAAETSQTIPVYMGEDRPLAGFLYIHEYTGVFYGCILVERDDPVTRRRFSVAHELGHYVLHFMPLLEVQPQDTAPEAMILAEGLTYIDEHEDVTDIPSGQLTFTRGMRPKTCTLISDVQQMEREANQFAAELLMPAPVCRALVERYGRRFGNRQSVLARRLAGEFLVSREAMRWRLKNLGLPESLTGASTE
jgi:hypothetical protein